ncbi:MAG: hypothetical protein KDD66_18125 [Bdellovibrionales bacterium]|nr:hypothetical protein [Bdellovibrionales bacterium]
MRSKRVLIFLSLLLPNLSFAQNVATSCVSISGNLDASETELSSGVASIPNTPPDVASPSGTTFSDLATIDSNSIFSTEFDAVDSAGNSRTVTTYYYKYASDRWSVRSYVDGSDIEGGVAGEPYRISTISLSFNVDGTLLQALGNPMHVGVLWSGDAQRSDFTLSLASFTQFAIPSSPSEINTNCSNGPKRYVIRDFDGDYKSDIVIWRPEDASWYIRYSADDSTETIQWGLPGDIPLEGDYDGDRVPDLVVWRPSTGTWYVRTSSSNYASFIQQQWGLPGDRPVRGDFDGDGTFDLAVWRPMFGLLYVIRSSDQQQMVTQWGLSSDVVVGSDLGVCSW